MQNVLIAAGANVNCKDSKGRTALHSAVMQGNEELIHALIEAKTDINASDKDGNTPLIVASQEGVVKIAQILTTHGADPNVNRCDEAAALTCAVLANNIALVVLLLQQGADINSGAANVILTNRYQETERAHMTEILGAAGASTNNSFLEPILFCFIFRSSDSLIVELIKQYSGRVFK